MVHTMDYLNDTPIFRKNKHLNAYERGQIVLLYTLTQCPTNRGRVKRPKIINDSSEFGHWEIDTVIGKKLKIKQHYLL